MYQVPQTRIFTQYAESSTVTSSALTACLVGPHYIVHSGVALGEFNSESATYPYIGKGGTDIIETGDLTKVFSCEIRNAKLQARVPVTYSTTEGAAGYLGNGGKSLNAGNIVADGGGVGVPAGFRKLNIGDIVVQKGSTGTLKKVAVITGFMPANAAAAVVSLPTYSERLPHNVGDATLSGTHTYGTNALLKFTVTTAGTNSTAKFSLSIDDGPAVQTDIESGDTLTPTGLTTMTFTLAGSTNWAVGETVTYGIATTTSYTEQYQQGLCVIILDSALTGASGDTFTFYSNVGTIEHPTGASFDATGLNLPATLSRNGEQIYSGDVHATYRFRSVELSHRIHTLTSSYEIEGLLGAVSPLNPLGMMAYLALLNSDGAPVSVVSTEEETVNGYTKAFGLVEESTDTWSIVPFSQELEIQQLAKATAERCCSADVMNWKTAWFGYDVPETEELFTSLTGAFHIPAYWNDPEEEESTDTSNNLYITNTSLYDITKLKYGDRIVIDGVEEIVTSVFTAVAHPFIQVSSAHTVGNVSGVRVYRQNTASDVIDSVKARARAFSSELVRLFFGDTPYLPGWESYECSMSYVAAAWAGKRSGVAPHQGLTRSTINGIGFRNSKGFSVAALNEMAAYGTWLTVTDKLDGSVYCRHQLTTVNQDVNYELREDSKIANAHEVSKTIRSAMDDYYGRSNVTESAIEAIRLKFSTTVTGIISRPWSSLIGEQVTALNELTIAKSANFSDRVDIRCSLATPDPLNNLDIYLTIA